MISVYYAATTPSSGSTRRLSKKETTGTNGRCNMWAFEEMLASRKHLDTLSYIYRVALSYRRPLCIARPLYSPLVLGLVDLKNPPKSSPALLLCPSTVPLSLVSGGMHGSEPAIGNVLLGFAEHHDGNDATVESQYLGENEDEYHADVEAGLLGARSDYTSLGQRVDSQMTIKFTQDALSLSLSLSPTTPATINNKHKK